MSVKRVLTMTFEFDLVDRKSHRARLIAAHNAALYAVTEAVKKELVEGTLSDVTTRMNYDYRLVQAPATTYDAESVLGADEDEAIAEYEEI